MMRKLLLASAVLLAPALHAQTALPGIPPSAPGSGSAVPQSLFDQPPAAPAVTYADGKLTIHAMNSSLRAILDDLQTRTGVKVQGLAKDERIFGVYGPGAPQDVLSALLDDSGYNVMIAGRRGDGAPREIVLSARTGGSAPSAPGAQPTQAANDTDDGEPPDQQPAPQPALFGPNNQGGFGPPGQFSPPNQFGQPGQQPGQQPNGQQGNGQDGQPVKTPQQILEELQRLRQTQPPPQ